MSLKGKGAVQKEKKKKEEIVWSKVWVQKRKKTFPIIDLENQHRFMIDFKNG